MPKPSKRDQSRRRPPSLPTTDDEAKVLELLLLQELTPDQETRVKAWLEPRKKRVHDAYIAEPFNPQKRYELLGMM